MATLNASYMTLADHAAQTSKSGEIIPVIEMLSKTNMILDHAPAIECNNGTSHVSSVRTGLPTGTWTALYEGVAQEKGRTRQVQDTTARLEGLSTVDKRLLALSKNPAQVRLNEAAGFIEGMSQTAATALFYSTLTDQRKFLGLAPRFSSLSAENGQQIIDAGGTGSDNMSVWMMTWSERTCHLIYPHLSSENDDGVTAAGIRRQDKGEQRVLDGSGNPYFVKEEHFGFHFGVAVRDWRYVVRIANIDASDLAAGSVDTLSLLRSAFYQMQGRAPVGGGGDTVNAKTCIYAPREFIEAYDEDITDKTNVELTIEKAGGMYSAVSAYRGIPIYETDALLLTEAQVT